MRRDVRLVDELAVGLRRRRETVSFAESCTGGLLSSMITSHAGISDVYLGAVVAYSNAMKENLLGVPSHLFRSVGAVSVSVAREMARGARDQIGSDWAVSITGIAGPGGGTPEKPVGTVCFAVVGPGVDRAVDMHFAGGRQVIQEASALYALELLLGELGSGS